MKTDLLFAQILSNTTCQAGTPMSTAAVEALESGLGVRFPADYKKYLETFGWLTIGSRELMGGGKGIAPYLDAASTIVSWREAGAGVPPSDGLFIPLEDTGDGNYTGIKLSAASDGKRSPVYTWYHDDPVKPFVREASSLTAWLASLYADVADVGYAEIPKRVLETPGAQQMLRVISLMRSHPKCKVHRGCTAQEYADMVTSCGVRLPAEYQVLLRTVGFVRIGNRHVAGLGPDANDLHKYDMTYGQLDKRSLLSTYVDMLNVHLIHLSDELRPRDNHFWTIEGLPDYATFVVIDRRNIKDGVAPIRLFSGRDPERWHIREGKLLAPSLSDHILTLMEAER